MNRKIAFRAWDKLKEKWCDDCIGHRNEVLLDCPNENYVDEINNVFNDETIIWMQFTGLKDKNGKEIYEGDIVKTNNEYYPIQIVQYTADIINEHDGDWDEWYVGFDLRVPGDECDVLHYRLTGEDEVIGNIYENKDLL